MAARRGQKEAVAPTKPGSIGLPTEHLQLMAKHHDLQVLGVLAAPHEPSEDPPKDQGHGRPHHGIPPASDMLSDPTGLPPGTPIMHKCTLQARTPRTSDSVRQAAGAGSEAPENFWAASRDRLALAHACNKEHLETWASSAPTRDGPAVPTDVPQTDGELVTRASRYGDVC